MNFKVNNRQLLLLAGMVWIVAGANILRIGILTWLTDSQYWLFKAGEATLVFLIFFNLIFKKLYNKHTDRICKKANNNHLLSFFDFKGWIIMFFMITLGVTVRKFQLLPNSFISVFYTGLSTALIITGILFFRKGINYAQS
ncbi:hypothetical protein [uncultured Bacteroides sp.]|uniref:hypothetical protein n=1 Tax=uncultured Bacteroides sp. TaxID=162156 RepID=UPI002AAAE1E0|nr:hypothetical protein [uncultured Bacteroides sp.]